MNKPTYNNIFDILIIGGGCGGIFAATTGCFFGYKCCLVEKNNFLGGQVAQLYPNKFIYDFPGKIKIRSKNILDDLIVQLKNTDTTILLERDIINISEEDNVFEIKFSQGQNIFTKNIIIATGVGALESIKLEIENKEVKQNNIIYSIDENENIYSNKKIVILGGGDSAIDWANHFVTEKISNMVSIIHRRDEYRANFAKIKKMQANKIAEYLNFEIIKISENDILIKDNKNKKEIKIEFDFLLVQYGQKNISTSIDFFNSLNKTHNNKIIVDLNQKTNIKNIYAIGDSIHYENKANTIVTAVAEGTKAIWSIYKESKKL